MMSAGLARNSSMESVTATPGAKVERSFSWWLRSKIRLSSSSEPLVSRKRALSSLSWRTTARPTVPRPARAIRERGGTSLLLVANAFPLQVLEIELAVDGADRVGKSIAVDHAGDPDLGATDELDVDPLVG